MKRIRLSESIDFIEKQRLFFYCSRKEPQCIDVDLVNRVCGVIEIKQVNLETFTSGHNVVTRIELTLLLKTPKTRQKKKKKEKRKVICKTTNTSQQKETNYGK